jgi:hypothetical protein
MASPSVNEQQRLCGERGTLELSELARLIEEHRWKSFVEPNFNSLAEVPMTQNFWLSQSFAMVHQPLDDSVVRQQVSSTWLMAQQPLAIAHHGSVISYQVRSSANRHGSKPSDTSRQPWLISQPQRVQSSGIYFWLTS